MWVCLHEATHRLQFTAVPWLREHFSQEVGRFLSMADGARGSLLDRLPEAISAIRGSGGDSLVLVELLQGPEQRAVLDRLLALTTLLEGHADHVMDAVGPAVVPTVTTIRRRFDDRRKRKQPPLQRIVRALLGFDAKLSQYTRGKAFVDHVVGRVGMARFNAIWSSPETLPLPTEIDGPQRWIDRVL
jgi:coenzyme F420 biosynthesis associated uncharacterized protein